MINKDAQGQVKDLSQQQSYRQPGGKAAVFVSKNRFAVLDKSRQVWLKDLKNETKRKLNLGNMVVHNLFAGGIGRLLLRTSDSMVLYDTQVLKVVSRLAMSGRNPIKVLCVCLFV